MKCSFPQPDFKLDPAAQIWLASELDRVREEGEAKLVRMREVAEIELARVCEQARQAHQATAHRDAQLKCAEIKIQALTLELAHHRRMRFGRKSEQFSAEQQDLFEESWASDQAAIAAELASVAPVKRAPRAKAGRQPLPAHLPRVQFRHEPDSCTCGQCGKALVLIGEDVSEQLDVEPARFTVHRHIRPQYACRGCETVSAAPVPAAVIDGSMATPRLLAWVMVSKFMDHLPLYRIEQIAARSKVPLARSTQAQWVGRVGVGLQPLADRLADLLRQAQVLHADETPIAQLDPGRGKTRSAYLWAYRSNDLEGGPPIVVFDYQISRAGVHARTFLGKWRGQLMVDDYSGYKALFAPGMDPEGKPRAALTELACLAHVRRKFFEIHQANPGASPVAQEALRRIQALYAIESEARERALDAQARAQLRLSQAQPLLHALFAWLTQSLALAAPNSGTAKAIQYTLRRKEAICRYAESGIAPIDNNPVENAIRPIAIGKKNWLYAGSERAGKRAAAIQSLLGTARLNGIDPMAWLTQTLEKLPTWPNSRIDELLPLRSAQNPSSQD